MLLTGLITLLIAIPLYSSSITSVHFSRITFILFIYSAALAYNCLYVIQLDNGLGLYRGLFNVRCVRLSLEMFIYIIGAIILTCTVRHAAKVSTVEYPLIIIFTTIGASFLISRADLVSMYLSIELQRFAVYILAAIYRNSETATNAGLKYFLLGALSRALILLGSRLIYAYIGLTNFDMLHSIISQPLPTFGGQYGHSMINGNVSPLTAHGLFPFSLGIFIIMIGFLFKVRAAPLHNWAPDVYDGVPTIVTTWLTIMPKISLFTFLLYLVSKTVRYGSTERLKLQLFLIRSTFSLVIGRIVGLAQSRIKRLLAYSTISHVGFMLLALSVYNEDRISAFIFYLIVYSLTNLNIFMVLLAFGKGTVVSTEGGQGVHGYKDISLISSLSGQIRENPILVITFALSLFSMAGIPPLLGFFAKYFVLYSAIQNGYYFISLIAILTRVISASYYLRIIRITHHSSRNLKDGAITRTHSYIIRILTLPILLYMFNPSLLLNSNNLLALSYFSR